MKIANISYSGFGGLESVIFSLISADLKKNNDWYIAFIGEQPLDERYVARCKAYNVTYSMHRSTPGFPFLAWLNMASWLKKMKPDIVICHTINPILICKWYAKLNKATLIAVEHASPQTKSRSEWVFSYLSMFLADKIILLTKEYKAEFKKSLGKFFFSHKVKLIANGIDLKVFYPSKLNRSLNGLIKIGMAARFSFSKRQDILILVLEQLSILRPDLFFELKLAGNGNELECVKKLATSHSNLNLVSFDGLLSEEEVSSWLRELDIYVHATDAETLSTSLLQAMASSLPIVSSDISGVRNLLGDSGEYGLCVPNDPKIFAKTIIYLLENPTLSKDLGRRARKFTEEKYGNEDMLQNYLKVIEECRTKS